MKTRVLLTLMFAAVLCLPQAVIAKVYHSEVTGKPTFLYPLSRVPPTREYLLYVPTSYSGDRPYPLVVMLHGCNQTAESFAAGTGMNDVAERNHFLVLYPNEIDDVNLPSRCWAWSDAVTQNGRGEAAIIIKMVQEVNDSFQVDASRIYVAGLSAGGAMASNLAACYPGIFAAAAIHSGVEYKGSVLWTAIWDLRSGDALDPDDAGSLAYECSKKTNHLMPVVVFHGMADGIVDPQHAPIVVKQFIQMNDLIDDGMDNNSIRERTPFREPPQGDRYGYTVYDFYTRQDPQRTLLLRLFRIDEMKHAWSGGQPSPVDPYYDPRGPDASEEAWSFFAMHTRD